MKSPRSAQSATSLPRAPRDDVDARSIRYLATMGVRVLCFVLMVFITPYGWYTWVLGAGAVFLPYIAVVMANVGRSTRRSGRQDPERALPASATEPVRLTDGSVVTLHEVRTVSDGRAPRGDASGPAS